MRKIAPYMLFGDYYPLTPYSLQLDQWIAWQFDRPETGEGLVQAFRRGQSDQDSLRVKLHGLEPEALYALTNFDVPGSTEAFGRQLRDDGLAINVKDQPGAAVITYQKKR